MKTLLTFMITLFAIPGLSSGAANSQSSTISGLVLDEAGKPVPGATVFFNNQTGLIHSKAGFVPDQPVIRATVSSDANGVYITPDVPPGTYSLCAGGTKASHLMTCQWTSAPAVVTVGAGVSVANINFTVAEGTLLTINVSDPADRIVDLLDLPTNDGRVALAGGNFSVGVFSGSRFAKAMMILRSNGSRTYRVAVPKHADLRLFVGTSLNLADISGNPINPAAQLTEIVTNGETELSVSLAVP